MAVLKQDGGLQGLLNFLHVKSTGFYFSRGGQGSIVSQTYQELSPLGPEGLSQTKHLDPELPQMSVWLDRTVGHL